MPPIEDYNPSAALNTTLGTIPIGPGMAREKVNDALQQIVGDIGAVKGAITGVVHVKDNGAAPASSNATNKTAVQSVIDQFSSTQTGVGFINSDIDYGYVSTDPATYPDFTGKNGDFVLYDYSIGDADGGGNKAGAQVRVWMYTKQTSPTRGIHDGNTWWQRAAWHPSYIVSNDAQLAAVGDPSRLADDNRRASYYTAIDGETAWRIGQGSQLGAGFTDEELSNFTIEMVARVSGDTKATYIPLVIERKTGNWSIGGGTNTPFSSYDFTSLTTGYYQAAFINPFSTTSSVVLRNSTGLSDDVRLRNVAGAFEVFIEGTGAALTIEKATRRFGTSAAMKSRRILVTYSASITIDAALGNTFEIAVTNGTAFTINAPTNPETQRITIKISNQSGGAMGAITWNAAFKMATWANPASGFERSIDFIYDGANWRQVGTPVDVPN